MKRGLYLLLFLFFVTGCSSGTLEEAIMSSGFEHEQPDILYQNDEDGIVIFLTKNVDDEYMIVQSTYSKTFGNFYKVNKERDDGVVVDISNPFEFISLDEIDGSDHSIHIVWGGVFRYPGAEEVHYSVIDEDGDKFYESTVEINSNHVFVDLLNHDLSLTGTEKLMYEVLDQEGNVLHTQ